MSLTVTQPVINNSTGATGGTLTLQTGEIVTTALTSAASPALPGSATPDGTFGTIDFSSNVYCSVRSDAGAGDFFIVKNISAVSGTVALYNGSAGIASINGVSIASGSYIGFGLSSGKKIVVYTKTAGVISVSYL